MIESYDVPHPVSGTPARLVFSAFVSLEDPPPISINHAYSTFRGRRVLTKEGRTYKDALSRAMAQSSNGWKRATDGIYQEAGWAALYLAVYLPNLVNKSWAPGAQTKTGPQNPYQRQDLTNYVKLIEDAIVRATGIDDCNTLDVVLSKRLDVVRPRIEVDYRVYAPCLDTRRS